MEPEWNKQTEQQLVSKRLVYFTISGAISAILLVLSELFPVAIFELIAFTFPGFAFAIALTLIRPKKRDARVSLFVIMFTIFSAFFSMSFTYLVVSSGSEFVMLGSSLDIVALLVLAFFVMIPGALPGFIVAGAYGHFLSWQHPKVWKTGVTGGLVYAGIFIVIIASQLFIPWQYTMVHLAIFVLVWHLVVGWLFCQPTKEDRAYEVKQVRRLIDTMGKP